MLKARLARKWYIYALIDQRTKKPFYIGITCQWEQRREAHLGNPCVQALCDIKPTMECIRVVGSEKLARSIERHLIRKLPGLVNVMHSTNGFKSNSSSSISLEPVETYRVVSEHDVA